MATVFEVVLPFGAADGQRRAEAALDQIDTLESQLTIYRDTSEVSRLNRLAARAPVPVEPHLFRLLQLCQTIHQATGGAFDITSGPLIRAWGFHRRQGRVPDDATLRQARDATGMQHIELDPESNRVRYLRPDMEINLGSIGKGYALDRAALLFAGEVAMLQGGTSSVLALPGPENGWRIGVKHPSDTRRLGTLTLQHRAMASSATTYQRFDYNGKQVGHLLDPRSGRPAEGVSLAVALAPTAAEADALSTAFFVLGIEATREYCQAHPEVSAILLADRPEAEPTPINLAESDWTPAEPNETYDPWEQIEE